MLLLTLLFGLLLTSAQGQQDAKESEDDFSCTLSDGSIGECVSYYLCNNGTIDDGGLNVIDIRAGDDNGCQSYFDTCCQSTDKEESPVTPKPEPVRQGCGWRNPQGVGFRTTGDVDGETKFGEFPWMAAILQLEPVDYDKPNGPKLNVYKGGGSLIHHQVVLTAAHYVASNNSYRIRAGEWDTQTTKEIYPLQDRDVASKEIHKDVNLGTLFFDIALLFLEKPFDVAPNLGVACLPLPKQIIAEGTRCFATGWGKNKLDKTAHYHTILKKIEVPIVERKACQVALRKTRLGRHFKLHTSFMCAGGEKDKDLCRGDGGSPLSCPVLLQKDRYVQSGIVAWGIGCGEDGVPGVYVDVAYLRDWVDEKMIANGYDTKSYTI